MTQGKLENPEEIPENQKITTRGTVGIIGKNDQEIGIMTGIEEEAEIATRSTTAGIVMTIAIGEDLP